MLRLREDRPATIEERRLLRNQNAAYRNALMWALDYFGASNLTEKERLRGVQQIANVLTGRPSHAASYIPNEWDESAKLKR